MGPRKRRVLILPIIDWLGGTEHRFHRLFNDCLSDAFEINVIHFSHEQRAIRDSNLKSIRFPTIPSRGIAQYYLSNLPFLSISLLHYVLKSRPDLIVSGNPIAGAILAVTRKLHQIPIVFDFSDDYPSFVSEHSSRLLEPLLRTIVKILLDRSITGATRNVTSASGLSRYVRKVGDVIPIEIPNGVFLNRFSKSHGKIGSKKIVGYLGGLFEWSGIKDLIAAFDDLIQLHPEAELQIYGYGPLSSYVHKASSERKSVTFYGEVPFIKVPEVLARFYVAVIPFVKNLITDSACPMKLFEYWASGIPVVTRNLYETKRIAGDAVQYFSTISELVECISRCFHSKELRQALVERGFERVQQYDWKKIAAEYATLIDSVIDSRTY